MKDHAAEATIATLGQKLAVGGGGTAFLAGLTANHIAAIGGLIVGIIGLILQAHYKRREDLRQLRDDEREEEFHRLRLERFKFKPYEDDSNG